MNSPPSDGPGPLRPRVLVTGAAGRLGRLAVEHLRALGVDVVATDVVGGPGCVPADLTAPITQWRHLLAGVGAILHCAGHRGPGTNWADAQRLNIDLSLRLMLEARRQGVGRFVFLSSNWVMAGYRFEDGPITTDLPPHPINPYGMAKLAIERAGMAMAEAGDFAFVALRIGMGLGREEDVASRLAGVRRWSQIRWLSAADFCQAIEKALLSPLAASCIVNLTSGTDDTRWDLSSAREALGYVPADHWRLDVPSAHDADEPAFALVERCRIAAIHGLTAGSEMSGTQALAACRESLSAPLDPVPPSRPDAATDRRTRS